MADLNVNQTITLHPENDGFTDLYPNTVKNLTIAWNLVVNVNGAQISGFRWSDITTLDTGSRVYYYRVLMQQNGVNPITDMSEIKAYLKHMTGSDFVPVYNTNEPNDEFIFLTDPSISDENRVWKYQYNENDRVLLAFRVDNFPFALKSQVKPFPKTLDTMAGVVDTDYSRIYYDIYDANLSEVKALSIRIELEENNKDNWGTFFVESRRGGIVFKAGDGVLQNVQCKFDSFEGTNARFELLIDSSDPQVNLNDMNFANATITLF